MHISSSADAAFGQRIAARLGRLADPAAVRDIDCFRLA
jgi:hypothetical protein